MKNVNKRKGFSFLSGVLVQAFILPIKGYRKYISPLLSQRCRYYPTCSQYAIDALQAHGFGKGIALGVLRVGRCHPWSEGGIDHVPAHGQWRGSQEIEISTINNQQVAA